MEPYRRKTSEQISAEIAEKYRTAGKDQRSKGSMTYEGRTGLLKTLTKLLWNDAPPEDEAEAWEKIQQRGQDFQEAKQIEGNRLSLVQEERERNGEQTDNFTNLLKIVVPAFALWFLACIFTGRTLLPTEFFLETFQVFRNIGWIPSLLLAIVVVLILRRISLSPRDKED